MAEIIPFKRYDHEYGACIHCDCEKFFLVLTDDDEDFNVLAVECTYCGQTALVKPDEEIEFIPDF